MTKVSSLLLSRLREYEGQSDQAQTNAAKEIIQEIALLGLARGGFFRRAAFHGDTAFRVFYNLDRFSEELDFCLLSPDPTFAIDAFFEPLLLELSAWGLEAEISARSKTDRVVQKAFLKDSSLGGLLNLRHPLHSMQKLRVKLELDINPPLHAGSQQMLCEFPVDCYVTCHDLPTMFSGKLYALLRRPHAKGRDWYDFAVYTSRKVTPNLLFLRSALAQQSEEGLPIEISLEWLRTALVDRIDLIDIEQLIQDVRPFLPDDRVLNLWSREYFKEKASRLLGTV